MTFTGRIPRSVDGRAAAGAATAAGIVGRTILILRRVRQPFSRCGSVPRAPARSDRARDASLALVDAATSMPTAGRSCWRAARIARGACATGSRRATSSRSRPRPCRSRPATRPTCTPSRPSSSRPTARATPLYLHTSPEFACKKLLAAGERRIFEFARVFRNRERGAAAPPGVHHAGMVSRRASPTRPLMADCARSAALAARDRRDATSLRFRGRSADPFAEPERLTVAEAFERYAGIDLLATLAPAASRDRDALAAQAAARRHPRSPPTTPGRDIFSRVLVERIEPQLGIGRADDPRRISAPRGGAGAAEAGATRASPSASSSMPAASSSPTASAS